MTAAVEAICCLQLQPWLGLHEQRKENEVKLHDAICVNINVMHQKLQSF